MLPIAQIFIAILDFDMASAVGVQGCLFDCEKTLTKGRQLCGQIMGHFHGTKMPLNRLELFSNYLSRPLRYRCWHFVYVNLNEHYE